jgi:hypothetical protein
MAESSGREGGVAGAGREVGAAGAGLPEVGAAGVDHAASAGAAGSRPAGATQHPAAMLYGTGHIVVYGNPPFQALFGAPILGLPAAEALLDLPRAAFELMDLVYREGRPLARWINMDGARWRLTVAERRDIGTGEVYGIAMHLVPSEVGSTAG